MFFSLLFIWFVTIYNANFKISGYELVVNYNNSIKDFLSETIEVILLVGVLLIIILSLLEVDNNVASFDAFYITCFGRTNFHSSKLIAYLIIIACYLTYLYLGILLIYLWRFQNIYYLNFILKMYLDTLFYMCYLFLVAYNLLLISKNHFSSITIILFYWFSKIIKNNKLDQFFKVILMRLNFNYEKFSFGFEINYFYVILNIVIHLGLNYFIYLKKDLKC